MKEHLFIQHELRTSLSRAFGDWSAERRRTYMLRGDAVPASADHNVWPAGDVTDVAITVLGPDTTALQHWLGEPALLPFCSEGWSPLGYDVCDNVLTSGLINCGYAGDEVESLVARWGGRLNRWHLFDQVDDAFAFAIVNDARVPEHAPFGVFRVYVAESLNVDTAWQEAVHIGQVP